MFDIAKINSSWDFTSAGGLKPFGMLLELKHVFGLACDLDCDYVIASMMPCTHVF